MILTTLLRQLLPFRQLKITVCAQRACFRLGMDLENTTAARGFQADDVGSSRGCQVRAIYGNITSWRRQTD
jgi:hypothetical protein